MGTNTKLWKSSKNSPALRNQVCILWQRSDEKVENDTVKGGRIGVFPGGGRVLKKVWVGMCRSGFKGRVA